MKSVLLIFDNLSEIDFIKTLLSENGYSVSISRTLEEGIDQLKKRTPNLTVINTIDSADQLQLSVDKIKALLPPHCNLLCLVELENYLKKTNDQHYFVKPTQAPEIIIKLDQKYIK